MKLFGKRIFGKREDEQEETEAVQEDAEEETETEPERPRGKREKGAAGRNAGRTTANVERLAAKVEALSELRKTDAERFPRISEQIGELRNLILDKEAEIRGIGERAEKAAEMVGELQPENILSEVKKSTTKYDVLEARIEAANSLYRKVVEELKGLRKRLALFQGAEELMKLNRETSDNLANMKRIQASIEGQANKIGNIYTQFQKQANELVKYRDAAAALADEFSNIKKAVDEIKVKAQSALIDKKDLDKASAELRNELNKKVQALQSTAWKPLQAAQPKGAGSEQLIIDVIKETRQRLDEKDREAGKDLAEVKKLKAEVESSAGNIRNALQQFQKQANDLGRHREELKAAREEYKKLAAAVNEIKLKAQTAMIDKRGIDSLKAEFDGKLKRAENKLAQSLQQKEDTTAKIESQTEELKKQLATYATQKKFSEQLILDTLKEAKERLEKKEETRSIRNELNNLKDRLYETTSAIAAKENHGRPDGSQGSASFEVPGIERETLADFENKLAQLKEAINRRNTHAAIILYNEIRESYVTAVKGGLPEGRKYGVRSRLLDAHKALSELVKSGAKQQF